MSHQVTTATLPCIYDLAFECDATGAVDTVHSTLLADGWRPVKKLVMVAVPLRHSGHSAVGLYFLSKNWVLMRDCPKVFGCSRQFLNYRYMRHIGPQSQVPVLRIRGQKQVARFDQVTRGMFNVGKASVLVFFDYDALKLEDLVPYKKDNSRKRRASDYRDRRFQARIRCSAAVPGDEAVDTTSGDERSSDSDSGGDGYQYRSARRAGSSVLQALTEAEVEMLHWVSSDANWNRPLQPTAPPALSFPALTVTGPATVAPREREPQEEDGYRAARTPDDDEHDLLLLSEQDPLWSSWPSTATTTASASPSLGSATPSAECSSPDSELCLLMDQLEQNLHTQHPDADDDDPDYQYPF